MPSTGSDTARRAQDPRAQLQAATRCRSARSPRCATFPARTACRATTSIRRGRARRRRRARLFARARRIDDHGEARGRDPAATASPPSGRRSPSSRSAAGNTAMFAFVLAVVFVFLVLAAQYESLSLAAGGHPDRADVPARLRSPASSCAGMDNNILTQVGFVVLVGLAAKNAILIVEFAKPARGSGAEPLGGGGRGGAAAAAADPDDLVRLHPRRRAAGLGDRRRRRAAPDAGHGGVRRHDRRDRLRPVFTPVFYVIARWIAQLGPRRGKKPAPSPQAAE